MKTLAVIALAALALAGCGDKGLKVGSTLQDCAGIAANQREDAARAIKFTLTRDQAVKALADKFKISPEAAGACLK